MRDNSTKHIFQNNMIKQLLANGWLLGKPSGYNRALAIYEEDLLGFVKETQDDQWQKFSKIYLDDTDKKFLERVASQLNKADPNASDKSLRSFGTLGVLRHGIRDRGIRFNICQFKPDHDLNPDTLVRYQHNRCRIVPELVYSPWTTTKEEAATGIKAKASHIDIVLFVNGLPVATLELKSECRQSVENAIKQYKTTRLPIDPTTKKKEPLLTFKRGALVHFAVSQHEVYMTTKLAGDETLFLPFNKGTKDGGKGNDIPENQDQYATNYLWNQVLLPDNLLNIIGRFIHLEIKDSENWEGRKVKKETLIFPRFHQWDVVTKLVEAARSEGAGQKYLIQHSAGSGKSNSIAWTAHQLSSLYNESDKLFNSVIIVIDRIVLDAQLQDTIYQFEHIDGVVGRINNQEGGGSKSEKLAKALENCQPIIIVTIQTFPFVLQAIANSTDLKSRRYAIIADEAHSSQTGSTASKLKEVLSIDGNSSSAKATNKGSEQLESDDAISAIVAQRGKAANLSYFAFTATPKSKTIETFGRLPNPDEPPSLTNKPAAYHVYSMRQAIEEGFILDVLKNYTSYKVAYNLAQKMQGVDKEVESKKAKAKLNQWVRLHDYNISQKVQVIIEHFKDNIMGLLGGQAKAMVVTSSRKEAMRYKLAFDKYISEHNYKKIQPIVAFSGEVEFTEKAPNSNHLIGETLINTKYTELSANPNLKGRDMRKAFDSDDYQVMIVANKFQTGFDQPKLCAMYVDKKLGGVECVQTLSRLNRITPSKAETGTFILDFINDPQDILKAFQPYYQTAELANVSDPNIIHDLFKKLKAGGIFTWQEVEQFCQAFYIKNKSNAAISNICKPAIERWQKRYKLTIDSYIEAKDIFERTQPAGDTVLIDNAESTLSEAKKAKDELKMFKKDLGSYVRFYEFMSQITSFDDTDLEKLNLYAKSLCPMLREVVVEDEEIDLSNVVLSHYRLSKIRQQDLQLKEDAAASLAGSDSLGRGTAKDREEDFLSQVISRLNDLFSGDNLTDNDMLSYAKTLTGKLAENTTVMNQVNNNSAEQAMLGDFAGALDNAVMDSNAAQQDMMMQYLSNPEIAKGVAHIVFDMLKQGQVAPTTAR